MSKLLKGAIIGLMIAGFAGCVNTNDIKVAALKSEKVNLKGYKTYQIIEDSEVVYDSKESWIPRDMDVSAELEQMISAELVKKGKIAVKDNPDFYVAYFAAADFDAIKSKVDKKGQVTIEEAPDAAMLLLLVDADTGKIIWLSSAVGDVKGLPDDQMAKRLNYAVKKMLSGL